jgi:Spy/CpxP family protein refolding chaperone
MLAKVLVTSFAVALAAAQGVGGGGGMGGGGRNSSMGEGGMNGGNMGAGGSRVQKESKGDQIVNRLKLNNDQKSEFITIMESTRKDASPIVQMLLKSRQDLANAMIQGKTDAEIAPLTQALSDAQFQMTGVEVKTFQKIVALLKPNQVSKAPEAFDLMADIFLPQPGRGGR